MATRGETVINELLTKVGLVGVVDATAAAKAYDTSLDGVSVSSDGVTKAQLSLDRSVTGMARKYDEVSRAAAELAKVQRMNAAQAAQGRGSDVERLIAEEGATNRLTQALQKQAAARKVLADTPIVHPMAAAMKTEIIDPMARAMASASGAIPALAGSGKAAVTAGKNFGLAGHQIQNLGFQLNDLVTQIGSGQGFFRPLLQQGAQIVQIFQQGEGGIRGALSGIMASLGRIGPLGIAAFGTAGLAGAVGLSSVALSKHGAELERSEAKLRAFSSRSSEVIGIAQRVSTTLGVSATGGFRTLADETLRFGQAMSIVNVDEFVTNFGRLALSQREFVGLADESAAAFAKLQAQGNLTSGDLIKFADAFPQFAGAIARALRVPQDELKRMRQDIPVTGKAVADAINNAGAAASANVRPWSQLSSSIGTFVDNVARLASTSLDQWLDTTAKEVYALAGAWSKAVDAVEDYARKVLGLPAAPAAAAPAPATRPDAGGGKAAFEAWAKESAANDDKLLGAVTRTADNTASTSDNTEGSAKDEGIWRIYQNAETVKARVAETAANTGATVSAVNNLGSKFEGAFDRAAAAANTSALGSKPKSASFTAGLFGSDRFSAFGRAELDRNFLYGAGPSFGELVNQAASGEARTFPGGVDHLEKAVEAMPDATAKAIESLDLGSLGAPIQSKIDTLRNLQETALSRVYRPDPYAQKNPDFFYSGERIFKEQQDKVYDGLQTQISKLEGLQASLATLVYQNESFPSAIVNAMIAAGFGDIAAQIVAAFRSVPGAPTSATPPPTAVQTAAFTPPTVWKPPVKGFNAQTGTWTF